MPLNTPFRTKTEAIKIIYDCAVLYNKNLSGKNVLFLTEHNHKSDYFETLFMPHNFMHLTGAKSRLNGELFFRAAVNNRLGINDITLATDGTTDLKLDVLPQLMNIHLLARMVGDYENVKPLLITDKLTGTVTMAMGFVFANHVYIPNSALKKDIRDITSQATRQKVTAIFVKPRQNDKYSTLTYIAKGLTIDDDILQPVLREKVDMQNLTAAFPIPKKQ